MHPQIRSLYSPTETRRRLPRACLALALGALVLIATPGVATADWNVTTFVTLRDEAQALYNAGDYAEALPRYRVLESMIDEALANDEIPAEQRSAAREGLDIARYQIARSEQGLEDCAAAVQSYRALEDSATSADIRAKVAGRLAESQLCVAEQALASGDDSRAEAELQATLVALDALPPRAGLATDTLEVLDATATVARRADALRTTLLERRLMTARTALVTERCPAARQATQTATTLASTGEQIMAVTALGQEVEAMCLRLDEEAALAASMPADDGFEVPVGPVVLLSVGAAVLIGDAVFEATVVDDELDRFESLRESCRTTGIGCRDAIDARDEVEFDRAISIALLSVGGAALVGGATWWIVEAALDSDTGAPDARVDSGFVTPRRDGAVVGVSWTLP